MKKSIIFVILTLIAVMCVFVSCGNKECQHQWSSETTPATCLENGKTVNTCTLCGLQQEQITGVATGHNYVKTTLTEPTCSTTGEEAEKCENCGLINEATKNPIPKTNHVYDEVLSTSDPTCEDKGITVKKCKNCDKTNKVETAALGHKWENKEDVIKQVSCTEDGEVIKYQVCSVCEASTKDQATPETVTKWDHDLIHNESDPDYKDEYLKEVKAATCDTNEIRIYKCINEGCDEVYEREIRNTALGHKFSPGIELTEKSHNATCELPKTTYYKCENDGCTEEKTVTEGNALGHDHSVIMGDEKIPATCLTNEFIVKKCSRCEDRIEVEQEDTVLGHLFTEDLGVVSEANCSENEVKNWGCERCDAEQERETENSALNHVYPAGHANAGESAIVKNIVVAPKCNADGYTTQKCMLCNSTDFPNVDINTNRPDHTRNASDTGTEVLPTCITDGYYAFKCTVCGENDKVPSGKPATGVHGNYTKKGTVHAPTCTEAGYTEYICTLDENCTAIDPASNTRDVVAVIDHEFSGTAEGVIACDECGTKFYDINYAETYVKDSENNDVNEKETPFDEDSSLKVTVTLGKVNDTFTVTTENKTFSKDFASDAENISVIRIRTGYDTTSFTVKVNGNVVATNLTGESCYYLDIVEIGTVESIEIVATGDDVDATIEIFDAQVNEA